MSKADTRQAPQSPASFGFYRAPLYLLIPQRACRRDLLRALDCRYASEGLQHPRHSATRDPTAYRLRRRQPAWGVERRSFRSMRSPRALPTSLDTCSRWIRPGHAAQEHWFDPNRARHGRPAAGLTESCVPVLWQLRHALPRTKEQAGRFSPSAPRAPPYRREPSPWPAGSRVCREDHLQLFLTSPARIVCQHFDVVGASGQLGQRQRLGKERLGCDAATRANGMAVLPQESRSRAAHALPADAMRQRDPVQAFELRCGGAPGASDCNAAGAMPSMTAGASTRRLAFACPVLALEADAPAASPLGRVDEGTPRSCMSADRVLRDFATESPSS